MRKRVDLNQQEIVDLARQLGASVCSLTNIGYGCPDLLVGHRGNNYLIEIKNGSKLTPAQEKWQHIWQGNSAIINNVDELLKVLFPENEKVI